MMIGDSRGRTFPIKIDEVLKALKKNRKEHYEIVKESQKNYRKKAVKELTKMLKDAKNGKKIKRAIECPVPTSHLGAYDNAIDILHATQRAGSETVDLTSDEYERFVKDNWEWQNSFRASNFMYTDKFR